MSTLNNARRVPDSKATFQAQNAAYAAGQASRVSLRRVEDVVTALNKKVGQIATDAGWQDAFRRLADRKWKRYPHVIAYGFGEAPPFIWLVTQSAANAS